MTESNAAQPGLTDDEIRDIITDAHQAYGAFKTGYGLALGRAIESALLSKLRAEGVQAGDERAKFLAWANKEYGITEGYELNESQRDILENQKGWMARAALASAPNSTDTENGIRWQAGAWDLTLTEVMVDGRRWYRDDDPKVLARAPVAGEANTGNHHTLKTDPEVFQAVTVGAKTFEIRLNDRGFQVGDALRLRETRFTGAEMREGKPLEYTGRECHRIVSHVLTGYGLADGWCCLSFAAPQASEAVRDPVAQVFEDLLMHGIAVQRIAPAEFLAAQADKPAECADGCPPNQVCDHCQGTSGKDVEPKTYAAGYHKGHRDALAIESAQRNIAPEADKDGGDCAKGAGDVLLAEIDEYLMCVVDGSMSRNNAETLAAELRVRVRAALAAQPGAQKEQNPEWMTCDKRGWMVRESLTRNAKGMRADEKRCRNAYNEDYMGAPTRYLADVFAEAADVFEARLKELPPQKKGAK